MYHLFSKVIFILCLHINNIYMESPYNRRKMTPGNRGHICLVLSLDDVVEVGEVFRPHLHISLISGTVGVCYSHLDDCTRLDGCVFKPADEINHHWVTGFKSRDCPQNRGTCRNNIHIHFSFQCHSPDVTESVGFIIITLRYNCW